LDDEERAKPSHSHKLWAAICQPAVLYLCLIYALIQASVYGVVFYLPTQVAGLMGAKVGFTVGLVSAIPWLCALLATWWIPSHADRTGHRRNTASLTLVMAAAGIAVSVSVSTPLAGVLALCFAAAGFIAVQPVFWTFPSNALSGSVAAGGIALINSLGGVGGFVAPIVKNWAETVFHSPAAGLYLLAGTTLLAAVLVLGLRDTAPAAARTHAAA
ncbi:MAG TPA: MFS transporter, partial [Bordetella sp.]